MSYRKKLEAEPHRFDFFGVMRELERSAPEKPKIGQSTVPAQDIVKLGQDPFLEFSDTNIEAVEQRAGGVPNVRTRFLGFFGPQGALPLSTTIEAFTWSSQGWNGARPFASTAASSR